MADSEAVDHFSFFAEMAREGNVLREGTEIIAARECLRGNQGRRTHRFSVPGVAKVFEHAIEIVEKTQRKPGECDLSGPQKMDTFHANRACKCGMGGSGT